MYLLIGLCENPGFLRALYFVLLCMDAVFAIVPVVLIVMLLIDFSKSMIAGADDSVRKNNKLVLNRIITAIILFAIPWLISVFVNLMDQMGFSNGFTTCINRARIGNFDLYDNMYYDQKKDIEEARRADLANSRVIDEKDKAYSEGSAGTNTASGKTYSEAAVAMIDMAKSQLGQVGGKKYIGRTGLHWCAAFVTWNLKNTSIDGVGSVYSVFTKEGKITSDTLASGTTVQCYTHTNLDFYPSNYYGGNYTPKKGDIIYFWYRSQNSGYWDGDINHVAQGSNYAIDHVGLVDYVDDSGNVHTVEGNTGGTGNPDTNKVDSNTCALSSDSILGYCSWYKKG